MNPLLLLTVLSGLITLGQIVCAQSETGQILVEVKSLKSDAGQVGILLFDDSEGFPSQRSEAIKTALIQIQNGEARHVFSGLPFGSYALSVIHDENNNGKLDVNFLGIPREGFGTSNNPGKKMGPPEFSEAAVILNKEELVVPVRMKY